MTSSSPLLESVPMSHVIPAPEGTYVLVARRWAHALAADETPIKLIEKHVLVAWRYAEGDMSLRILPAVNFMASSQDEVAILHPEGRVSSITRNQSFDTVEAWTAAVEVLFRSPPSRAPYDGADAAWRGWTRRMNPYPVNSNEWAMWDSKWASFHDAGGKVGLPAHEPRAITDSPEDRREPDEEEEDEPDEEAEAREAAEREKAAIKSEMARLREAVEKIAEDGPEPVPAGPNPADDDFRHPSGRRPGEPSPGKRRRTKDEMAEDEAYFAGKADGRLSDDDEDISDLI